jgi:type IV pilus assembly protein PilM
MPSSAKRAERNPVLGIAFGYDQIRVVEIRRGGDGLTVTAAGSVSLPAGALEPGSTIAPDLIAQRLKSVIKKIGATATYAVMGVPSSGVFTRLLDIPQIPDDELESVVSGEVAHYQMIRPDRGAFGFSRLPTPENSREIQVLVMASDDPILHALDDIAKKAGLRLAAKEPAQLGAMRSLYQPSSSEATLLVSIEDSASEISVVEGGRLMLYRRIDVGGRNLLSNSPALAGVATGTGDGALKAYSGSVDEVLSARLATEIRRSLDYHRRQFPATDVSQAFVGAMDSRLGSMSEFLETALGIPCRTGAVSVRASGVAAAELGTPVSSEYFSAIGLAAGELGFGEGVMPAMDLVAAAPKKQMTLVNSGQLIAAVVATAIVLVAGLAVISSFKGEAERAEHETAKLQVREQELNAQLAPLKQRQEMEMKVLSDLSRQGTPFPWVMDAITAALDPGVGINQINIDGGHIRLSGEARNEAAMVTTLDHIRTQGSFTSPFVDSFQNQTATGLSFNMSSDFVVTGTPATPAPGASPFAGGSQ